MQESTNDSFLKDMVMRNAIFEKKLTVIQRSQEEQRRISTLYSQSRGYLEKLVSQTNEKIDYASQEIEIKRNETKSYVEGTIENLCSDFAGSDLLNDTNRRQTVINETSLNKYLNVPYDALEIKINNFKNEMLKELQTVNESTDLTYSKINDIRKSRESLSKEKAKEEKNISEWETLVEKKTANSVQLEADCSSKREKLSSLETDYQELEIKKIGLMEQIAVLEGKTEEAMKAKQKNVTDLSQKKDAEMKNLEDCYTKIMSISEYDESINSLFPQNDKINELLVEIKKANENLVQLRKEAGQNTFSFEMTEKDNLEVLNVESKFLQDQKLKMEIEVSQMKELRHQLLLKQQENHNTLAEVEGAKERVRQKSLKLKLLVKAKKENSLKKLEDAAKEVDVPVVRNIDFETPGMRRVSNSTAKINTQVKRISFESDFTNMPSDDFSYPGIRQLSTSMKKKIKEASQSVAKAPVVVKQKVSAVEEVNYDSSMDSSLISGDTGTTQEGSMMGGMFSPLSNRFEEEEDLLADKDSDDPIDFSMMDHFRDYTDRSIKPMKSSNTVSNADMTATPSPQDSVSKRFASDIFLKGNTPSEMSLNESEPSVLMSSLNDEDEEDADDSLMANDSDLDMDQSVWGSDM